MENRGLRGGSLNVVEVGGSLRGEGGGSRIEGWGRMGEELGFLRSRRSRESRGGGGSRIEGGLTIEGMGEQGRGSRIEDRGREGEDRGSIRIEDGRERVEEGRERAEEGGRGRIEDRERVEDRTRRKED